MEFIKKENDLIILIQKRKLKIFCIFLNESECYYNSIIFFLALNSYLKLPQY